MNWPPRRRAPIEAAGQFYLGRVFRRLDRLRFGGLVRRLGSRFGVLTRTTLLMQFPAFSGPMIRGTALAENGE